MVLIKTCCFCMAIKTGSIVSGVYVLILQGLFFTLGLISLKTVIHTGNFTALGFSIAAIVLAFVSIVTSIVMLLGLCMMNFVKRVRTKFVNLICFFYQVSGTIHNIVDFPRAMTNKSSMLLPWITAVTIWTMFNIAVAIHQAMFTNQDIASLVSIVVAEAVIIMLNIQALLCVISQYQEYKFGTRIVSHQNYEQEIALEKHQYDKSKENKNGLNAEQHYSGRGSTNSNYLLLPDVDRRTSLSTSTTLMTEDSASHRLSIDVSKAGYLLDVNHRLSIDSNTSFKGVNRNSKSGNKGKQVTFQEQFEHSSIVNDKRLPEISIIVESDSQASEERSDGKSELHLPKLETML